MFLLQNHVCYSERCFLLSPNITSTMVLILRCMAKQKLNFCTERFCDRKKPRYYSVIFQLFIYIEKIGVETKPKLICLKSKALFFSRTCHCSQTMGSLYIMLPSRAVSIKIFYLLKELHSTMLYYMMYHMSIHFVNCNII